LSKFKNILKETDQSFYKACKAESFTSKSVSSVMVEICFLINYLKGDLSYFNAISLEVLTQTYLTLGTG
jgi:hypothetical protein